MEHEKDLVKDFRDLYHQIENTGKYHGAEPIFKITNRGSQSLTDLTLPTSERTLKELIENLHIIINEGSGNGKRLPIKLDEKRTVQKIRILRNHYVHDQDHGSRSKVRKKYMQIGDIFQELLGVRAPSNDELWTLAGKVILERVNHFMNLLVNQYPNYDGFYIEKESDINHYFEHDITLFPDDRAPYIIIKKTDPLKHFSDAAVFIPHFSFSESPEFGPTKSAIHFSSRAYRAPLKNYLEFLNKIESFWEKNMEYQARETRNLYAWSISSDEEIKYGSGFKNLLKGINDTEIGLVTIFLIGCYGEDYSKTFFIIISNYWKYGVFRDNSLDLYLSNMPLDYTWVTEINESMKLLSKNAYIANSYSLKPYFSRYWKSKEKRYDLKSKVIGGIGRDGYDDERHWDQFVGIIMENHFSVTDFILEEADSPLEYNKENIVCPIEAFDKIVMSVTNTPPDVEEILSGKFHGISNPSIRELIFDGYGHEIHAILLWGVSLIEKTPRRDSKDK